MAKDGLKVALPFTLGFEGGFSNHPDDPGGPTMKGVTQANYDAFRIRKGLPTRSVKLITNAELQEIYNTKYYQVIKGDELPPGLDFAVFDFAVNSGPTQAAKELQRVLGVSVDGQIGDQTIKAANDAADADEEKLIADYCARRLAFMKKLKNWKSFKTGWTRRVIGLEDGAQPNDVGVIDIATAIARKDITFPVKKALIPDPIGTKPGETVSAKALPSETAVLKTNEGKGALTALTGAGGAATAVISAVANQAQQMGDKVQVISDATGKVVSGVKVAQPLFNTTTLLMLLCLLLLIVAGLGVAFFVYTFTQRQREKSVAYAGPHPEP